MTSSYEMHEPPCSSRRSTASRRRSPHHSPSPSRSSKRRPRRRSEEEDVEEYDRSSSSRRRRSSNHHYSRSRSRSRSRSHYDEEAERELCHGERSSCRSRRHHGRTSRYYDDRNGRDRYHSRYDDDYEDDDRESSHRRKHSSRYDDDNDRDYRQKRSRSKSRSETPPRCSTSTHAHDGDENLEKQTNKSAVGELKKQPSTDKRQTSNSLGSYSELGKESTTSVLLSPKSASKSIKPLRDSTSCKVFLRDISFTMKPDDFRAFVNETLRKFELSTQEQKQKQKQCNDAVTDCYPTPGKHPSWVLETRSSEDAELVMYLHGMKLPDGMPLHLSRHPMYQGPPPKYNCFQDFQANYRKQQKKDATNTTPRPDSEKCTGGDNHHHAVVDNEEDNVVELDCDSLRSPKFQAALRPPTPPRRSVSGEHECRKPMKDEPSAVDISPKKPEKKMAVPYSNNPLHARQVYAKASSDILRTAGSEQRMIEFFEKQMRKYNLCGPKDTPILRCRKMNTQLWGLECATEALAEKICWFHRIRFSQATIFMSRHHMVKLPRPKFLCYAEFLRHIQKHENNPHHAAAENPKEKHSPSTIDNEKDSPRKNIPTSNTVKTSHSPPSDDHLENPTTSKKRRLDFEPGDQKQPEKAPKVADADESETLRLKKELRRLANENILLKKRLLMAEQENKPVLKGATAQDPIALLDDDVDDEDDKEEPKVDRLKIISEEKSKLESDLALAKIELSTVSSELEQLMAVAEEKSKLELELAQTKEQLVAKTHDLECFREQLENSHQTWQQKEQEMNHRFAELSQILQETQMRCMKTEETLAHRATMLAEAREELQTLQKTIKDEKKSHKDTKVQLLAARSVKMESDYFDC